MAGAKYSIIKDLIDNVLFILFSKFLIENLKKKRSWGATNSQREQSISIILQTYNLC